MFVFYIEHILTILNEFFLLTPTFLSQPINAHKIEIQLLGEW